MLPDYEPTIKLQDIETAETTSNGRSFLFDFEAGDFVLKDGNLQAIEGKEALQVWIKKVLKTEKDKYKIYLSENEEYENVGTNIKDLTSGNYPQMFLQAELQREITEALLQNSEIKAVENFNFERDKRTLVVNFDVDSVYGAIRQEVFI